MKHLLVTTHTDLSVEEFRSFADIHFLDERVDISVDHAPYASVYFRSHFSKSETLPQNFSEAIAKISNQFRGENVHFVDGTQSVEEILAIEDKWNQYQIFGDYMPKTYRISEMTTHNGLIFKKCLSSRASGVTWDETLAQQDPAAWIAQEPLTIVEELRVYMLFGEVYPVAAVRQSKTKDQKVKVKAVRPLTNEEIAFARSVGRKAPQLEFIGLDIALTDSGMYLIEVNRSPDFASFTSLTNINLAKELYSGLGVLQ